jgi:predicted ArsR family transcriptional regulator
VSNALEDRLAVLGDPATLATLRYARVAGGPFGVDEAAAALGCHRSAARSRLDRLEAAGYLTAEYRRPPGRGGPGAGRPPKVFRVAPDVGVTEYPEHRFAELVALMLEDRHVPGDAERASLRAVGRRYAAALAGEGLRGEEGLGAALGAVCDRLGALGYQARVTGEGPGTATLRIPTCPLRPVVLAAPGAAELDRGMWEGLVGLSLGSAAGLRCTTGGCLDRDGECTVAVSLEAAAERSA